jgi:hypothetical protein
MIFHFYARTLLRIESEAELAAAPQQAKASFGRPSM